MRRALFIASCAAAAACAHAETPAPVTDDATLADGAERSALALAANCLASPWIDDFVKMYGRAPVIKTVPVIKRFRGELRSGLILRPFEQRLFESGRVRFTVMLGQDLVNDAERFRQRYTASASTAKPFSGELPSDFTLQTRIDREEESSGRVRYDIEMRLVRIENDEKVWIADEAIRIQPTEPAPAASPVR